MKTLVVLSILLIGLFNTVSAVYFLGQDTGTSLIGMASAALVVVLLWLSNINIAGSHGTVWACILLANLAVAGGVIASHAVPSLRAMLYTPSKQFVRQQKAYQKLLD